MALKNPVMTASGTAGYGTELAASFDLAELGAVVVKSLAAFEWPGNPAPRLHPTAAGMLNSVGLQGPGLPHWLAEVLPGLLGTGATVVASIWGRTVEEFRAAAELLAAAPDGVVAVEVNLSCPNVDPGHRPDPRHGAGIFAHDPALSAEVVSTVAACRRPAGVGQVEPEHRSCRRGRRRRQGGRRRGSDVRQHAARPGVRHGRHGEAALGGGTGGLSGPAIHPVAVRIVHDVATSLPGFPVIGVGGIATAWDATEFLLAGAVAVQVGTATFHDPRAPIQILPLARRVGAVGASEHTFVVAPAYPQFTASAALAFPDMATPPTLTPEQRAAALEKAKEARAARADIKARLKMGSLSLKAALESDDNNVGKLKVQSMLESLPGVGKVKARKVMDEIGIADNRRIQGLGSQQRQALLEALG